MKQQAILIVEDEPWLAEAYAKAIDQSGWHAVAVRTAPEAIIAVDNYQPIAIVLDIMLAGVNGIQLLHELRSYKDLAQLPVVVCSSLTHNLDAKQLEAYGVRRVLLKTKVTPKSLITAIREVLAEAKAI